MTDESLTCQWLLTVARRRSHRHTASGTAVLRQCRRGDGIQRHWQWAVPVLACWQRLSGAPRCGQWRQCGILFYLFYMAMCAKPRLDEARKNVLCPQLSLLSACPSCPVVGGCDKPPTPVVRLSAVRFKPAKHCFAGKTVILGYWEAYNRREPTRLAYPESLKGG